MKLLTSSLLLVVPALVLGAPSINQTLASLTRRQFTQPAIDHITFEDGICANGVPCNSCTSDSVHIEISDASEPGSIPAASIGFDRWRVSIDENEAVAGFEREMACVFRYHLKDFPTGCTAATMVSGFHFFTQLEDGLQAKVTYSFNLQPQNIGSPTGGRFEQNQFNTPSADEFVEPHTGRARVVRGDDSQPQPVYSVEIRAFIVSDGVGKSWGEWNLENLSLGINPPTSC